MLDLYLPDIFGLDLLNQMRVQGLLCDVIVISAGNESKTVQQAVQLGVTNYLLKPFTFADLRTTARRLQTASGHKSPVPTGRPVGDRPALRTPGNVPAGTATEGHESGNGHADPDQGCEQRRAVYRPRNAPNRSAYPGSALAATSSTTRAKGLMSVTLRYGNAGRPERRYAMIQRQPNA